MEETSHAFRGFRCDSEHVMSFRFLVHEKLVLSQHKLKVLMLKSTKKLALSFVITRESDYSLMKREKNLKTGKTRIPIISEVYNIPRVRNTDFYNIVYTIDSPIFGVLRDIYAF